jgi:XTP/dITP diphosphohydrolase/tetrapyrrole methylase family protein/MazG family protein
LTAREVWKQVRKKQLDAGTTVATARVDELAQGLDEATAGRRLFELVAACRDAGIDPDSALRRQTADVVSTAERNAHGD